MDGDGRRRTRWLIAGAVVVTVVLVVAPTVVPADSLVGRSAIDAVQVVLSLGAAAWIVAAMIRQRRRGPARFVVRDGAFVVPGNQAFGFHVVGQLLLLGVLVGRTVDLWARDVVPGAPRWVDVVVAVWLSVLVGPLVLLEAVLVVKVFQDRPILVLTPDALVVRDPFSVQTYPWESLAPWSGYTLRLPVVRPELAVRRGIGWWGPRAALGLADVHPWFFADAARLYLLRPDRRAGIGTRGEYDRLLVDLGCLSPRAETTGPGVRNHPRT